MSAMPKIDLVKLSEVLSKSDMVLVRGIVATRGPNKGCLRASKPKLVRTKVADPDSPYGYRIHKDTIEAKTAYLWRMIAFMISPKSQHQCMPVMAVYDLPVSSVSDEGKAMIKELDALTDAILATVPLSECHGLRRWGNAFGLTGTRQLTAEGAYIYR